MVDSKKEAFATCIRLVHVSECYERISVVSNSLLCTWARHFTLPLSLQSRTVYLYGEA